MEIITGATQIYIDTFAGFVNPFLEWGQMLFVGLVGINLAWLGLMYAFDKDSIVHGMSAFIKQYFVIMLFYSIMSHPEWLMSLLKSSESMGKALTGIPVDPSSIISNGISIANKVLESIAWTSLLISPIAVIIPIAVYGIVLFCFIAVALELAVTLILCNALIVVSSFFLGFAALGATSSIARQTLDVILANCVKLLGIYLVVAVGANSINLITNGIPSKLIAFDAYAWTTATSLLFWQVSKHLPNQLARIVSGTVSEQHGAELAALIMTAPRYAKAATAPLKLATSVGLSAVRMAGSVAYNAAVRMGGSSSTKPAGMVLRATAGAAADAAKAGVGTLSDNFKNIMNKSAGGPGVGNSPGNAGKSAIPGFSERVYQSTQDFKARSENSPNMSSSMDKPTSKPPLNS